MDYDPTSKENCMAICSSLNIDPEKFWGHVNDFACDCYFEGQRNIMTNGPTNIAKNHIMTKEQALAWIEKIYG